MKKLTPAQQTLMNEITASDNGFYYNIRQINTVKALVRRGLIVERKAGDYGSKVYLVETENQEVASEITERTRIYPEGHHKA